MARQIDPVHFEKFFASVALGNGAAISMFHHDGTMLARYPHADSMVGQKFRNAPLLDKVLTEGGRQTLRVQSPVDGTDRLGSAAALNRFPIVVVATTTVSAALADWQAQTRFMVAAAVLSALVIAFVLLPDHPAGDPPEPGIAAAAGPAKAAARHRPEQHDAGPRAVRRIGAHHPLQPALYRHVRAVDRHRQTGLPLSRPDPASSGHRILRRRRRRILFGHHAQRCAGQGHPHEHGERGDVHI